MTLIRFVDGDGKSLQQDARTLFGLKEMQHVVVRGRASRDEHGNLSVLATALYARPK